MSKVHPSIYSMMMVCRSFISSDQITTTATILVHHGHEVDKRISVLYDMRTEAQIISTTIATA